MPEHNFRKDCIAFAENSPHYNHCEALSNMYFCTDDCPFHKAGTDEDRFKRDREIEDYRMQHGGNKN